MPSGLQCSPYRNTLKKFQPSVNNINIMSLSDISISHDYFKAFFYTLERSMDWKISLIFKGAYSSRISVVCFIKKNWQKQKLYSIKQAKPFTRAGKVHHVGAITYCFVGQNHWSLSFNKRLLPSYAEVITIKLTKGMYLPTSW